MIGSYGMRERRLDYAVASYFAANPNRRWCTCFGCVVGIRQNFRVLERLECAPA